MIDLPPTGFIVFMGDNSNGKSVIVRATRDLLFNNIKKPQTRYDLVNKKAAFGEIIYTRDDGAVLIMHLAREAAATYISLTLPGKEMVTRYLADKNYMELVKAFGWNVVDDTDITLNISESDDALFFFKTPLRNNCKALQSATSDPLADKALAKFKETLSDARKFRDNAASSARVITSTLNNLVIHDVEALSVKRQKVEFYYRNLGAIYLPKLPVIKPVPKVRMYSVHTPKLPTIKYPRLYSISCTIPDITPIANDLKALREKKCPTCGRGFTCDC